MRNYVAVIFLLQRVLRADHGRHILYLLGGITTTVVGGGALFAWIEHYAVTTGWYWAITTATTVGYGDVTPHDAGGRILASVVMLTAIPMLGASFALLTGSTIARGLRRLLPVSSSFPEPGYRLVIGSHSSVPAILDELVRSGASVVLVSDVDPVTVPPGVHMVPGDPTSPTVLRSAQPASANHALVAGADDGDTLVIAVLLREQAPAVPVTALCSSASVAEALRELGVAQVLFGADLVAHALAKTLEAPHAGELLIRLLCSDEARLVERTVPADAPARPLSSLRAEQQGLLLGFVGKDDGGVALGVSDDPEVGPGDVLLVVEPLPT